MKEGTMIYDARNDRMDIRFGLEEYYGGLHCGECLEVKIHDQWVQTRIEMQWPDEWYLVGIKTNNLQGLKVRI